MKYYSTLRKAVALALLSIVSIAAQGQSPSVGPFYVEGPQYSMDTRQIDWAQFEDILPAKSALTRGDSEYSRWIDRVAGMPDYMLDFYQLYGEKVKEVLAGGSNWLSDPTAAYDASAGSSRLVYKEFEGSVDFSTSGDISQNAADAVNSAVNKIATEADLFMRYLVLCLNYDYPEAFWTGNSSNWGSGWSYSYSYSGKATYKLSLYFTLQTKTFDYRLKTFSTQSAISEAVTEFNNKVNAVTSLFEGMSRYEQVAGLNDWLTKHNCYNSDLLATNTADEIAWCPLSALRESVGALGPVCEGYARAMKILCDKLDIPCILANGNARNNLYEAGEAHMWNEVKMDDDCWYAVDVTWNDPTVSGVNQKESGMESRKWLLLGSKDEVASGFTFEQSHPNSPGFQSSGVDQLEILFTTLIEDDGYQVGAQPKEQLEKPTISFADGKLKFNCAVEGVTYHWTIANSNGGSGTGSEVSFSPAYTVTVYATKSGWKQSETTTLEIPAGDVNCDGQVNVADHVKLTDMIMAQ